MKARIVIGMNYGDEGKGHITDYLSGPNTLVVKHNGGSQAGHAVVTASGDEHVFHHFGAGTLQRARTLLARRFIVNPIMFMKELDKLLGLRALRETFIDPRCIVTTPYDMMINKYITGLKNSRDTVGVGINETVERCSYDQISLNVRELKELTKAELLAKFKQIENEWIPFRLKQLDLNEAGFKHWAGSMLTFDMEEKFIDYTKWMMDRSVVWQDSNVIERFIDKDPGNRDVVFEGGQGMLLDQRRKKFHPYLTRSNTGIKNVNKIIRDIKQDVDAEILLVTRSYLTRHGDGPMLNSDAMRIPEDSTNLENAFQGKMRFGKLDANWYSEAIVETETACKFDAPVWVAMTCLDQTDGKVDFWNGDTVKAEDLPEVSLISTGRTTLDVRPKVIVGA